MQAATTASLLVLSSANVTLITQNFIPKAASPLLATFLCLPVAPYHGAPKSKLLLQCQAQNLNILLILMPQALVCLCLPFNELGITQTSSSTILTDNKSVNSAPLPAVAPLNILI